MSQASLRVIINADDFGYDADTVHATIRAFRYGVLTSASIMPAMPATEKACRFARSWSQASFGVHLTLVRDTVESAVCKASDIPSLVDSRGALRGSHEMHLRALSGGLSEADIARETAAQLGRVRDLGVHISHVDSHGHLHKFPVFRRALLQVLPRFGVHRIRNRQNVYLAVPWQSPTYWLGHMWGSPAKEGCRTTDWFFMPARPAAEAWPERLMERVREGAFEKPCETQHRRSLARGGSGAEEDTGPSRGVTLEVGVHPGRAEPWRAREATEVAVFAELLRDARVPLIGWDAV